MKSDTFSHSSARHIAIDAFYTVQLDSSDSQRSNVMSNIDFEQTWRAQRGVAWRGVAWRDSVLQSRTVRND